MSKYILAHDLGTSGNKATLYNFEGRLVSSTVFEYPSYYPMSGYVEQNPDDWWKAVCICTAELMNKVSIKNSEIACVCFSAQMMGCLLVDRNGNALRNMITWADLRSTKQAEHIENVLGMETVYKITGHRISASYSAAKLLWIMDEQPDIYKKAYKMLHAKDYVIYKLTGKFVSDYSDASGTNLLNLSTKKWSQEILAELGINESILPELHPSTDIAGVTTMEAAAQTGLLQGTPVVIGGGDGSCACVGAGVVKEGKTYNVIGTSSWISSASKTPVFDEQMRTFNWVHLDSKLYTPCGTMQTAGYALSWLKNTLCESEILEANSKGVSPYQIIDEKILCSPAGANGLLFLPYMLGERSPRWNPNARGTLLGLSITSTKEDILRSVLEGIGYNLKVILDIFDQKISVDEIVMIGGGTKGDVWLQILSDIWQKKLLVPEYLEEATSMGAAICGGVGIGAFKNFDVINQFNQIKRIIQPRRENKAVYEKLYNAFNEAYYGLECTFEILAEIK